MSDWTRSETIQPREDYEFTYTYTVNVTEYEGKVTFSCSPRSVSESVYRTISYRDADVDV